MSQSLVDKCAAITSLLELVFYHLDRAPGAMHVQRYGESEGAPPEGRREPLVYNVDCNGRCARCIEAHSGKRPVCPPEEVWAAERAYFRREYRIADVWESLERLSGHEPSWAQAVWTLYVEPCLDFRSECIAPGHKAERDRCAREGVEWMAHDIRGDVRAFGEIDSKERERIEIDGCIRQMIECGFPVERIKAEVHVGSDRIKKVRDALSQTYDDLRVPCRAAVGG